MSIVLPDFNWKTERHLARIYQRTLLGGVMMLCFLSSAWAESEPASLSPLDMGNASRPVTASPFEDGVKAYREGDYRQAGKVFETLHRQAPENTRFTYYLAITEAQLGRFQQAKKLYSEIVTLDPNGEAATLAKEGLRYLPPEATMDLPPRFSQQPALGARGNSPSGSPANTTPVGQAAGSSVTGGMSPQDLMAWQMLMGQGGYGNTTGNNAMGSFIPGMMMGAPNGTSGAPGMDPGMMSTMMMNQMMQNMNLSGEQNGNR